LRINKTVGGKNLVVPNTILCCEQIKDGDYREMDTASGKKVTNLISDTIFL
jgi:hypothetical protein